MTEDKTRHIRGGFVISHSNAARCERANRPRQEKKKIAIKIAVSGTKSGDESQSDT